MKFTVCTLWTKEIKNFATAVESNHRAYASAHGYNFHVCRYNPTDRPAAWGKIIVLLSQLETSDYLLWIDADAIFTNFQKKLESFLVEDKDFIVGTNFQGVNTGVFIIKNSVWSKKWLHTIYNMSKFANHCWWEQAAIIESLKDEEVKSHSMILESGIIQNFHWDWKPGDFVLHTPGLPANEKEKILLRNVVCFPQMPDINLTAV